MSKYKVKECTFKPKLSEFIYSLDNSTKTKKLVKRPKSAKNISTEEIERFQRGKDRDWAYPTNTTGLADRREALDNYYPWMVSSVTKVLAKDPNLTKYNNPMLNSKKSIKDMNKTF